MGRDGAKEFTRTCWLAKQPLGGHSTDHLPAIDGSFFLPRGSIHFPRAVGSAAVGLAPAGAGLSSRVPGATARSPRRRRDHLPPANGGVSCGVPLKQPTKRGIPAPPPSRKKKHTLELQMESANLSSTTDESRVQLMSLEYDEYRLDFRGQRGDLVGKQVRS